MEYFLTLLLCFLIVFLCSIHVYRYLNERQHYWKQRGVNGPNPLPIIGNVLDLVKLSSNELQVKWMREYGTVFGHMLFSQPFLTVADPEVIKQIAIKDFPVFNHRLNLFVGDYFLAQTLPCLNGNHWKRVRNIVSPTFSSGKIRRMFPLVDYCVKQTLKHVENIADEDRDVELKKLMTAYTMDVTVKCVFAIDTDSYANPNGQFLCNAYEFLRFRLWRVIFCAFMPHKAQIFLNITLIPKYLIEYFMKIVNHIIEERKRCDRQYNDFIKLLIDAEYNEDNENDVNLSQTVVENKKLNTSEITAQSIAYFTGGYETSASLLNFGVYALSLHGSVQEKLYEELSQHFPAEIDDFDKLNTLPYLDAVLNETLRHYSPVCCFDRQASEDCRLNGSGILIPKGTVITLPYYAIHHNPDYFPEPYLFKPERFLPENRSSIKPYTFIPFGIGPRNCVGMRFAILSDKLFIANLVKYFKIMATKNTPERPKFTGKMFILTSEPLYVKFERR